MSTEMENRAGAGTILRKIREKAEAEAQAIRKDSADRADALRASILKEADKRSREILDTAGENRPGRFVRAAASRRPSLPGLQAWMRSTAVWTRCGKW